MKIKKSLQAIKAELVHKETTLKILHKHYPHLAQFSEEQILKRFNVSTINELKEHIKYITESSLPATSHTITDNTMCSCNDEKGEWKYLYDTQARAQHEANELMINKRLKLKVYPCPYSYGWHLTKV